MGVEVSFENPDIVVHYDVERDSLSLEVRPVYVYGRYLKFVRGMRQTMIRNSECIGTDCLSKPVDEWSVEGLVIPIITEAHGGSGGVLHAAGREDIDVRMLGTGRPFVAEVKEPKRRHVDLKALEEKINSVYRGVVAVRMLRYVNHDIVKKITVYSPLHTKTYVLKVKFSDVLNIEALRKVESRLRGATIKQRTPKRVLWRRVDKTRFKKVYEVKAYMTGPREAMFIIRCQGGLYIKELATGDEGRTKPSIRDIVNKDVEVVSLDVISVAPDLESRLFKT